MDGKEIRPQKRLEIRISYFIAVWCYGQRIAAESSSLSPAGFKQVVSIGTGCKSPSCTCSGVASPSHWISFHDLCPRYSRTYLSVGVKWVPWSKRSQSGASNKMIVRVKWPFFTEIVPISALFTLLPYLAHSLWFCGTQCSSDAFVRLQGNAFSLLLQSPAAQLLFVSHIVQMFDIA